MKPLNMAELDAPPAPPEYLVDGWLERQCVTILSGDSGTAKSLVAQSIAAAVVQGKPWLGQTVKRGRVVYVDEENPRRIVLDRLRGLGLRSNHRDLAYYNRQGVALGDQTWNSSLRDEVRRHRADLVVIDTVSAATTVEVNDNTAVVRLYQEVLRPLAVDHDCAVLLLHHERKSAPGNNFPRNAAHAMMGARQWAGQADLHLTIERANGEQYHDEELRVDGRWDVFRFKLGNPKNRDGSEEGAEVEVTSLRSYDGALQWLRVDGSELAVTATPTLARKIVRYVMSDGGTLGPKEIGQAINCNPTTGSFKAALKEAQELGVEKVAHGQYRFKGPKG